MSTKRLVFDLSQNVALNEALNEVNSLDDGEAMKLVIFGATGRTGVHLVKQALAAGHSVTALVRTPAKLTLQHERLTVLQGDAQDAAKVAQAVAGAEAVISVLGPTRNRPAFAVSKSTENILAAMR
jgi:putative NADH-flavin reductase